MVLGINMTIFEIIKKNGNRKVIVSIMGDIETAIDRAMAIVGKIIGGVEEKIVGLKRYYLEDLPDKFVIYIELPGVRKEDIDLYASERELYVKAKRSIKLPRLPETIEIPIKLPAPIEVDKVKAKFENGILIVEAPKLKAPKSIKIE